MHACFRQPGPPYFGLSRQFLHCPQSPELQPRHWPHRAERKRLPLRTTAPMPRFHAGWAHADGRRVRARRVSRLAGVLTAELRLGPHPVLLSRDGRRCRRRTRRRAASAKQRHQAHHARFEEGVLAARLGGTLGGAALLRARLSGAHGAGGGRGAPISDGIGWYS